MNDLKQTFQRKCLTLARAEALIFRHLLVFDVERRDSIEIIPDKR
jgi:hypothetical protein